MLCRITLPGSIYLGIVAILPNLFLELTGEGNNQNFPFGGTAVLIMVGVGSGHGQTDRDPADAAQLRRVPPLMRILIVGPQGAGKGTQAALLSREPAASRTSPPATSSGRTSTAGTELGVLAKKYMDAGDLVPDEVTSAMVDGPARPSRTPSRGFLLDGFPRTVPQAEWLAACCTRHDHDLDAVLLLEAPDDVLMERMLARGRADDTAEAIARRLELYHTETTPLLEYYGDLRGRDRRRRSVDEVQQRVLAALDSTFVRRPVSDA